METGALFQEYKMSSEARRELFMNMGIQPTILGLLCPYAYVFGFLGEAVLALILASVGVYFVLIFSWLETWRLRVTDDGVFVRSFFRWTLWDWSDFSRDHVKRGPALYAFTFSDLPANKITLDFSSLSRNDAESVLLICKRHWRKTTRIELPNHVFVQAGWGRRFTFTPNTLTISSFGKTRVYNWLDVQSVDILRASNDSDDCFAMRLLIDGRYYWVRFPVHAFAFISYALFPKTAETAADFIEQHVKPEKIHVYTQDGSTDKDGKDLWLALLKHTRRRFRLDAGFFALLGGSALVASSLAVIEFWQAGSFEKIPEGANRY